MASASKARQSVQISVYILHNLMFGCQRDIIWLRSLVKGLLWAARFCQVSMFTSNRLCPPLSLVLLHGVLLHAEGSRVAKQDFWP